MVEAEVERVEIAPATLRQVGCCAVRNQGHALLGDAAVRAQRRIEARKIVAALPAADDGEALGNDDEIADAIFRELEARARWTFSIRTPATSSERSRVRASRRFDAPSPLHAPTSRR